MRIRTQLIVAAFLLAVVPLAAIVTWSYHSSRRALESAYRQEAERQTRQMDRRLASIRSELDQRVRLAGALPLPESGASGEEAKNLVTVMGDASLVDALDFEPLRSGAAVAPPAAKKTKAAARPSGVPPAPAAPVSAPAPETPQVAAGEASPPAPPAPPEAPEPVVIQMPDVPPIPRFVLSEEHQELVSEIGALRGRLASESLEPEEQADIRAELQAAQAELTEAIREQRLEYNAQVREIAIARSVEQHRRERTARRSAARGGEDASPSRSASPPAEAEASASRAPAPTVRVEVRGATARDVERAAAEARKAALILGRNFHTPVSKEGELVGQLTARISAREVIRRVLGGSADDGDEVPFAIDREGTVYTRNDAERSRLFGLGIPSRVTQGKPVRDIPGWIVSLSTDPQSGLKYGVARPVSDNFGELRRTAAQNFALGLGLIAFALIGIVPLSNHLSRDVKLVTDGAERIAHGDLMTRLPVKSRNEFGQLARAFNRMAEDLSLHQQKLLEQERAAKEKELQQRLLAVEYDRKTSELEEARRFQLSMLPKVLPQHPSWDVAVFTRTATEVGGDYYDFHLSGDVLSVTIGDATGHGAKAGTMVTVVKTLFAGYDGASAPAQFLSEAEEKIRRMELGRMAMALSLARFEGRTLSLASAGMPPALVHRASAEKVEEVVLEATPLGTFGSDYPEKSLELTAGDSVLLMTDGFPELLNDSGQQLGYPGALDAFAEAAYSGENAAAVIARLAQAVRRWHGEGPPNDDVTFVVIRAT